MRASTIKDADEKSGVGFDDARRNLTDASEPSHRLPVIRDDRHSLPFTVAATVRASGKEKAADWRSTAFRN
jgi:hypothetical protein